MVGRGWLLVACVFAMGLGCDSEGSGRGGPATDAGAEVTGSADVADATTVPDLAGGADAADTTVPPPPDETPPVVRIATPEDGATVEGRVPVQVLAEDGVGVVRVVLAVDGVAATTLTTAPYEWTWDTAGLAPGAHTLRATAADAAGNTAVDSVDVTVAGDCVDGDCPPGSVRVVTPVDGARLCGTVTIEATATDDHGVARVRFEVDGAAIGEDEEAPYQQVWDTRAATDGVHALRVVAEDARGQEAAAGVSVEVRNTGVACDDVPNLTFTSPADGDYVYGAVELGVQASDDVGVTRVQFFVDNGMLAEDTSIPYRAEWDTDAFDEGAHTLKALAYDTADQDAATQVTVTVDRTPPEVALLSPADDAVFLETDTVHLSAAVTEAYRVADVRFVIDGLLDRPVDAPPWEADVPALSLGGGRHEVEVVVVDGAGHTARATAGFTVASPPTAEILAPADGATVADAVTVRVRATSAGYLTRADLYVDEVPEANLLYSLDDLGYAETVWSPRDPGRHSLRLVVENDAGLVAEDLVQVTAALPPALALLYCRDADCLLLSDGDVISGVVQLRAVVENGVAVARVELTSHGALIGVDDAAPFDFLWDVRDVPSGMYQVTATATTATGAEGVETLWLEVDTCDRDEDGYARATADCGGDDCNDLATGIHPDAPDPAGDGIDQDCDGADGAACAPPCDDGWVCEDGTCVPEPDCRVEGCDASACEACTYDAAAGEYRCALTCDADLEWCDAGTCRTRPDSGCTTPNAWGHCPLAVLSAYEIAEVPDPVAGVPGCCCDYTGDGESDNGFAAALEMLGGYSGTGRAELNALIADQIASGEFLTGFEVRGLPVGATDAASTTLVYWLLDDTDGDPSDNFANEQFAPDPAAFDVGGDPLVEWWGGDAVDGLLRAGPSQLVLPGWAFPFLGGVGFGDLSPRSLVTMEGAQLAATAEWRGPGRLALRGGRLCGYLTTPTLFGLLNEVASGCDCLGLTGDLITSEGGGYVCEPVDASGCSETDEQENVCRTLGQYCATMLAFFPSLLDLDLDDDGENDAMSIGARFEAVPAVLGD